MGPYACMERVWKPFNPILGETFEVDLDRGVKFFAEQVLFNTPQQSSQSCRSKDSGFLYSKLSLTSCELARQELL